MSTELKQSIKKDKKPLLMLALFALAIVLGVIGSTYRTAGDNPPPSENGYHHGNSVNRRGDLVSEEGVILKRGYSKPYAPPRIQAD